MGNEVITLVKDTSLANVIANKEIIMMAKEYSAKGPYLAAVLHRNFLPCLCRRTHPAAGLGREKMDYFRC